MGLGAASLSGTYGAADETDAIDTLRAAIDAGITLIDTADFYGAGHNEQLIGRALRPVDQEARGVTVAQLAIAWVLAQGDDVVALVGTRRPGRVAELADAAGVCLTPAELAAIDEAVPAGSVAGERYAAPLMAMLDSER